MAEVDEKTARKAAEDTVFEKYPDIKGGEVECRETKHRDGTFEALEVTIKKTIKPGIEDVVIARVGKDGKAKIIAVSG